MSTELYKNSKYILTRFYGGVKHGVMLQITPQCGEYLTFSKEELAQFIDKLKEVLCQSL